MGGDRKSERDPHSLEAVAVLVVIAIVVAGGLVGWFVGREMPSEAATEAATSAPEPGHVGGANLPVAEFGDPVKGAALWEAKACSDCHSIGGEGGTDAPPLDSMSGHLSAREIADMSGQIWNHVPAMVEHFKEEGIPFPNFSEGEMADLVAFLHSPRAGSPASGQTGEQEPAMEHTESSP